MGRILVAGSQARMVGFIEPHRAKCVPSKKQLRRSDVYEEGGWDLLVWS